jgi:shikimate kinase
MNRIFLTGYMGSGKSTIGKMLASTLGFSFIDLDIYIETKYHKTIAQIFSEKGEEKFRQIELKCLHQVAEFENTVIATGGGVPCFFDNMEFMNSQGRTFYIQLTAQQLSVRLEVSPVGKRPVLSDRKGDELCNFIEQGLIKRESFYLQSQHIVDGSGTVEKIVSDIASLI